MSSREETLRVLELSPVPTLLIDGQGTIIGANTLAAGIFGQPPEKLEGQPARELFAESDRRTWLRLFHRCVEAPDKWLREETIQISAVRADRSEFQATVALKPRPAGDDSLVVAGIQEISEVIRGKSDLRTSERRFRIASEYTEGIIQEVDFETGEMILVGKEADQLMGFPPGSFPRTVDGWFDLIHPEDRDRVWAGVQKVVDEGITDWHFRYRMRTADGSYRYWLDHGTVTEFADDGRPIKGVGAALDVTSEVERRQELREALSELESAREKLTEQSTYLQEEISESLHSDEIVGSSESFRYVMSQVLLVSQMDSTVLLSGETGTGKELLARLLHRRSGRNDQPLIKVNCATLPDTLIDSELFGYEKGAFSGATTRRTGRFELADKGTLFLDEIGEIPFDLQAKLLQVLESGEFERLGSSRTLKTDVRIIAATNRDLLRAVEEGRFRADLYYRLAVFPIEVPPLRKRRSDIRSLAMYFLSRSNVAHGKSVVEIPEATLAALEVYDWPGNVRELENIVERGVILSPGATLRIDVDALRRPSGPGGGAAIDIQASLDRSTDPEGTFTLEEIQRAHIAATLEACGWKVKGRGNAAERLGLNEATLRARMKKLGIERPPSG